MNIFSFELSQHSSANPFKHRSLSNCKLKTKYDLMLCIYDIRTAKLLAFCTATKLPRMNG